MNSQKITYLALRFAMAFIFLWAFFDKTFGLGFATTPEKAWINGGSPTFGFLNFGTHGPFVEFFKSLSGIPAVDWLFMIGLLGIGLTLLFNRFVKWGAISGIVMMLLMWSSLLPPENNPIIDEHIIYALVFAILAFKSERNELNL